MSGFKRMNEELTAYDQESARPFGDQQNLVRSQAEARSGLDDLVSIKEITVNKQQDNHQGECQPSLGISPAESRSSMNDLCSNEEVTGIEQEGFH